jgi:uncharacterized OsmC-like protein
MEEPRALNGLDVEGLRTAIAAVGAQPEAARARKSARVRWVDRLNFRAYVRNHSFEVDEPAHLAGKDAGPTSMEYVLGALGTCLATGFVFNATQRGIAIRNLEIALDSTQENYFTFLGLAATGHPGFDQVTVKLYVQADAEPALIEEVWRHTVNTSPVGTSLARTVNVDAAVEVIP